jgi:hypothetical protein
MTLISFGLILDLMGVVILGVDILRIQSRLRTAATERLDALNTIATEYGGIEEWMKCVGEDAYWTHFYSDEGRMLPDKDRFDPDAAQKSFVEAAEAISGLSQHIHKLGSLLLSASKADKKIAGFSLGFTILGLFLIVFGFSFQIYGSII